MWSTSAIIAKPNGIGGAATKDVVGSLQQIENIADGWGAVRIQFAHGEVWRKLFGDWVVTG